MAGYRPRNQNMLAKAKQLSMQEQNITSDYNSRLLLQGTWAPSLFRKLRSRKRYGQNINSINGSTKGGRMTTATRTVWNKWHLIPPRGEEFHIVEYTFMALSPNIYYDLEQDQYATPCYLVKWKLYIFPHAHWFVTSAKQLEVTHSQEQYSHEPHL